MQKTLGGDRLGSGNKMKVNLHGYERSTHDLGYLWRSTASAGTLIPFICEVALPGDTFDINLNLDVKTLPTIGPLFGSYKAQLDVFQAPIRLYNSHLHNNTLNIGRNMSQIKLPQIELTALKLSDGTGVLNEQNDLDNAQINPSSLLAYLGLRGIGITDETDGFPRQFNATPILIYWDTVKNYYSNKQEEIGYVIHTPAQALVNITQLDIINSGTSLTIPEAPTTPILGSLQSGTIFKITTGGATPLPEQIYALTQELGAISLKELAGTFTQGVPGQFEAFYNFSKYGPLTIMQWRYINTNDLATLEPTLQEFPLENIDKMRTEILGEKTFNTYVINDANLSPYKYLYEQPEGRPNVLSTQEGLAVKTYQSDLFNNWLSEEWIDGTGGITEVTAIDTSSGSFTLDTLNLSRKVYNMLNRIAVSDGTYNSWLDVVYTEERYKQCETPMYMGGLIKEVVFQEVISNSQSAEGTQPLGTLAGKGTLAHKHKGGKVTIKVDEPSYIMGIFSLTPRIDYSQGNKWDVNLKTMDDLHKPALDEIGFQDLITEQLAWWDTNEVTGEWVQKSAGKQPAWINYMTNVNQVRGNFAIKTNQMFMTLNRRYEPNTSTIKDLTTYIDPVKFNQIFAQTALDAQNFWVQIAVDMTVRRKMSAKIMPNL